MISAVGRNVIASQINLLKLAEESSSIKTFYPSEYGTDIEYWPSSAHEKPHQQKLKVRAYIRDSIKRLNIVYLVTGPFADLYVGKTSNPAFGSFDVKAKKATLLGDGKGEISLTTMEEYVSPPLPSISAVLTPVQRGKTTSSSTRAPRSSARQSTKSQFLHNNTSPDPTGIRKTDRRHKMGSFVRVSVWIEGF